MWKNGPIWSGGENFKWSISFAEFGVKIMPHVLFMQFEYPNWSGQIGSRRFDVLQIYNVQLVAKKTETVYGVDRCHQNLNSKCSLLSGGYKLKKSPCSVAICHRSKKMIFTGQFSPSQDSWLCLRCETCSHEKNSHPKVPGPTMTTMPPRCLDVWISFLPVAQNSITVTAKITKLHL